MSAVLTLFATAPKGMESLLADELRALGATTLKATRAGVGFEADLALAYKACLWSRVASRVLLRLAEFAADTPEALYQGVQTITWSEHLDPQGTLAVDLHCSQSRITHSHFGALKVKDAIVDQLRDAQGRRPSVDTERPQLRINVHLHRDVATLSIDLSGDSLHRRGYRESGALAPLKENLAAAILLRAGWPEIAVAGGGLADVMCGSGTLPIEAALIAGDIAPGLLRDYYGFLGWRGHDAGAWSALVAEADARRTAGLARIPPIRGYDRDAAAVRAALANVARAGLKAQVHIERREIADCVPEPRIESGLVVVNPPYGERLGEHSELPALYAALGEAFKRCYPNWHAAVFTGNPELGMRLGLRARRSHTFYNGALECRLFRFDIDPQWFLVPPPAPGRARIDVDAANSPGAQMFANRLRKNLKDLSKWARREGVSCYRVYDADMPEYALAVDLYRGAELWVHVQEYEAPASIDPERVRARRREALASLPGVLEVPVDNIYFKQRRRQKDGGQYEKLAEQADFYEVEEYGCRLLVNFTDYLDTGLFLDHRLTRRMLQQRAAGKRFLNLFGYTGSATVHAARGGARSTTTVDMSHTYIEWARRNLSLNGYGGPSHQLIQADVLSWLRTAPERRYDLIFLDPPTFSRSKRMDGTFDIQRDHVALINDTLRLLAPGGEMVFSNNLRRFRLDGAALADLDIEDITAQTIPRDFARDARIHNCYRIRRKQ